MAAAQQALDELVAINYLRAVIAAAETDPGDAGQAIAAQFQLDTAQGCAALIHGFTALAYDLAGMLSIAAESPPDSDPIDVLNGVELGLRSIIGQN